MASLADLPKHMAGYADWPRDELEKLDKLLSVPLMLGGGESRNYSDFLTDPAYVELSNICEQTGPVLSATREALAAREFADRVFASPSDYPDLQSYVEAGNYDHLVRELSNLSTEIWMEKWGFNEHSSPTGIQQEKAVESFVRSALSQEAGRIVQMLETLGVAINRSAFEPEQSSVTVVDAKFIADASNENKEHGQDIYTK